MALLINLVAKALVRFPANKDIIIHAYTALADIDNNDSGTDVDLDAVGILLLRA